MTKDEIIKLAESVGINFQDHIGVLGRSNITTLGSQRIEKIEAFARACYEAGRTAEKQECKRVCELEINRLSAIGEHRAALAVGICSTKIDERGKP